MPEKNPDVEPGHAELKALSARAAGGDEEALSEIHAHYLRLADDAQDGDRDAMEKMRALLEHLPSFWTTYDDIMKSALDAQLTVRCGADHMRRESCRRQVAQMCEELAGYDCSPLERLLAQRVALCWLQVQYADEIYFQNLPGMQPRWIEVHERRRDRAHQRFLSACKTLATVQKMSLPVLQVNIGDKQINVANVGLGDDANRP